ncbi:O-antigen ligase family protein [Arcticibacter eurypsychrophilus]|uniref:O-antigen ligase family protein n=1 Tax=Arcticibacter eurypsychrophilus TaxID=1434752 RepID=UPI00084DBD9B|nr:O-antigen ligase family protein [Arcticibacter eurypsychrophilus]
MENIKLNLKKIKGSWRDEKLSVYLKRIFIVEKLTNIPGLIFLSLFAIAFSFVMDKSGITGVSLILIVIIGLPTIFCIVRFPQIGIIIILIGAYFLMWIYGFISSFPLGTVMDGIEVLLILGFFIIQKKKSDWSLFKEPIGVIVLIWVGYNIMQIGNPAAESRLAWLYTIRAVAAVMLMYFIFSYNIRSLPFLKIILKLWLLLALFGAFYAFKQEFIGFSASEERALSDPRVKALYFINGHWRKFSIFSDPVAFAYNMVAPALFCISMLFSPLKTWKKLILSIMACIFLQAMLFSGTRGAYVLVPVALVLLVIVNLNRNVIIVSSIGAVLFALLIFTPSSSPSIRRFQSAFQPSEDASFNVRKENQKRIQPFIQTHPLGGGLGATGVWGTRFSPHSMLAKFPPDSGYVRAAVETGSIGLFLICTLMVIIIKTGINNFFSIKDLELRSYCLAMTIILFAFAVGNYPQEAIVQFPSNIYFYLFTAIITVTKRLDIEKQKKNLSPNFS